MAGQYEMRVGDAEREATVAELREHFASGRLTQEEFNQRVDQTFAAKTRGDLKAVTRDLPSVARPLVAAGASGSGNSGGPGAGGARPRRGVGAFAIMMTALWSLIALVSLLDFGFGFGGGRPIAIVIFLAALAMLRRLVFGRRRGMGPRGGRCGRRRW